MYGRSSSAYCPNSTLNLAVPPPRMKTVSFLPGEPGVRGRTVDVEDLERGVVDVEVVRDADAVPYLPDLAASDSHDGVDVIHVHGVAVDEEVAQAEEPRLAPRFGIRDVRCGGKASR